MKKSSFFNVLLFATAILFAGTSFTSCGSDDNKSNPEDGGGGDAPITNPLSGTWVDVENIAMAKPGNIAIYAFYDDANTLFADLVYNESLLDHANGYVGKYAVNANELTINITKVGYFDCGWMSEPKWQAQSSTEKYTFEIKEPGTGVTKDYKELHIKKGGVTIVFARKDIDESYIADYKKQFDK